MSPRAYMPPAQSQEWETPQALFDLLDREFRFDLDAAATGENAKCRRFWTREQDALRQAWDRRTYVNPPYGRDLGRWTAKALEEVRWDSSGPGKVIVMLLPVRTSTTWWRDHVMQAHEIRFLVGRLHFSGAGSGAPFANCVVIWGPGQRRTKLVTVHCWDWRRLVVDGAAEAAD